MMDVTTGTKLLSNHTKVRSKVIAAEENLRLSARQRVTRPFTQVLCSQRG